MQTVVSLEGYTMSGGYDDRDGKIWLDGDFVDWRDANVHVLTHAMHYASSVFEGERAYNGKIFKSFEHSERFKKSANLIDFEIPYTVEEIEKAKENAEQTGEPLQLFMLKKLLKRKKQLLASKSDTLNRLGLFGIEESAYNLNTMLMDRKEARNLPSDILLKNQRKEVDKNIRNLTQVTKDLTTASRNVQSSDNKVRKKQFIMHLLTHTFAFTLMLILVAMLMKNNILSQSLGYKIIGFLVTAMVIVIGANYYFNSNRNVIYFEKRDFPIAEEETATPLEKCDSPIGEDKWEAEKTDSGHTYYINSRTGQTAWTIPVAEEEEKAEEEEEKAEAESATESSST